jgi:hypothetical protein
MIWQIRLSYFPLLGDVFEFDCASCVHRRSVAAKKELISYLLSLISYLLSLISDLERAARERRRRPRTPTSPRSRRFRASSEAGSAGTFHPVQTVPALSVPSVRTFRHNPELELRCKNGISQLNKRTVATYFGL